MQSLIQDQILTKLLRSQGLRFSEARPEDVSDDLYNYHLKFLISKRLVTKEENVYKLTDKGKEYVQQYDAKGKIHEFFKVSVLAYVTRDWEGKKQILVQRRNRHPYFGDVEAGISGKVHIGESFTDAATRKLLEETGLQGEFTFLGAIRKIRRDLEGRIIEDTLYHPCLCQNPSGELVAHNEFGDSFWTSFETAFEHMKMNTTASEKSADIVKRIKEGNMESYYFFEDITLKNY